MSVDANGVLRLSDPWSATVFCATVLGLFLVIHHHVANTRPAVQRTMAVRARRRGRGARHATRGAFRRSLGADQVPRTVLAQRVLEPVVHDPAKPIRTASHEPRTRRIAA